MPSQPTPSAQLPVLAEKAAETALLHAAEADSARALPSPVVDAILEAGFARHFVPLEWGGTAGTATDLLSGAATLGAGCASAAWCASVIAGAARMGACLPVEGQREMWADGPDTVIVGALMPRGTATRHGDGWLVSGEWDFTSGVAISDWALVCAQVPGEDGPETRFFALPRADYRIADTWHPLGMRATGSNTLIVEEAYVPRHRGFLREAMLKGVATTSVARCHTVPLRVLSGLLFAAPALGAARAALDAWLARTAGRAGQEPGPRLVAARAVAGIDTAELLLRRAAQVADAASPSTTEELRNPADCALAVELLLDEVERLYRTVGTAGQLPPGPLQRVWRDVHGIAGHVALRFDPAGVAYGGHLLSAAARP
ncbi:hydrolase [Streptomyces sp. NL15-2K]|uniref:hydrolase n=1 Tax=Streptomyces sp. NL15-2K TaxID=376149 RepID=UPI000F58BF3C|nr:MULTISPECIES: hydrolase [Actinomycetes]WKX10984.1 hydrolase [Kutzneria buriramensis]GCB46924.1 pigment protein [Streptomyces sp. NL15-2K]